MMRSVMLSIVVAVLAVVAEPVPTSALTDSRVSSAASVSELQAGQPPTAVDVNANPGGGRVEPYWTPVRIAIGGAVILALVGLVVLAVWAGGETVGDAGFEDRIHSFDADEPDAEKRLLIPDEPDAEKLKQ